MRYSTRHRDRYRLAVAAVTGLTVAGAAVGTGALAGAAAQEHRRQQADQAQQAAEQQWAHYERQLARYDRQVARQARQARQSGTTVLRERPTGTRVTTRYVTGAAAGGTASVRSGAPPATTQGQPQSQPVQQTQPAPPQAPSVPKPTPKTSGS